MMKLTKMFALMGSISALAACGAEERALMREDVRGAIARPAHVDEAAWIAAMDEIHASVQDDWVDVERALSGPAVQAIAPIEARRHLAAENGGKVLIGDFMIGFAHAIGLDSGLWCHGSVCACDWIINEVVCTRASTCGWTSAGCGAV